MIFIETTRIFPDMPMWQSQQGSYTYIISLDDGLYAASAKPVGATPFDKTREDLGVFTDFESAKAECEEHAKDAAKPKSQ